MDLVIETCGKARCIYSEALPLPELGQPAIKRASHVEPNREGEWTADLSPVGGPTLGPFQKRTDALAAEVLWLREHWLVPVSS